MRLHRITDNVEGTAATPKMVILTRKIKIKGVCARTRSVAYALSDGDQVTVNQDINAGFLHTFESW
jgi:hypothetical protein